ncbi:hypothetical protein CUROG_00080 [Corynebacterium urogenitale]|uniref:Uncharacterized protein n=1 Tax=Corynebacterium urogenitale TaxID=2487892 RepID=A0A5J6Z702_9CORY|nr:hypothetical protein [Corynebacterium urogenitale]QFQ01423.1 hypothetical protein CUROG_00080 [Corynebacterium urogenitale]
MAENNDDSRDMRGRGNQDQGNQGREQQQAFTLFELLADAQDQPDPRFCLRIEAHDQTDLELWRRLRTFEERRLSEGAFSYLEEYFKDGLAVPFSWDVAEDPECFRQQVVSLPLKDALELMNIVALKSGDLVYRAIRSRWFSVRGVTIAYLMSLVERGWAQQIVYFNQLASFQHRIMETVPLSIRDSVVFHCGVGAEVLAYGRTKANSEAPVKGFLIGRMDAQSLEFSIDYDAIRELTASRAETIEVVIPEPGTLYEHKGQYRMKYDREGGLWTLRFSDKNTAERFFTDKRHQPLLDSYRVLIHAVAYEGMRPVAVDDTYFFVQPDFTLQALKMLPPVFPTINGMAETACGRRASSRPNTILPRMSCGVSKDDAHP